MNNSTLTGQAQSGILLLAEIEGFMALTNQTSRTRNPRGFYVGLVAALILWASTGSAAAQGGLLPGAAPDAPTTDILEEQLREAQAWQQQAEQWQQEADQWQQEADTWRGKAETWEQEAGAWQAAAHTWQSKSESLEAEAERLRGTADVRRRQIARLERELARADNGSDVAALQQELAAWRTQAGELEAEATHWRQEARTLQARLDRRDKALPYAFTYKAGNFLSSVPEHKRMDYMGDRRW